MLTQAVTASSPIYVLYRRGPLHIHSQDMYDICNILCPWDPIQEQEVHKPERKPRLGKGAKLTKRISSIPLLWSVKTSIPSIVKRLDYGYSRMRGGKFSNFFKRIRHTVGRRKFSLGVG